MMKFTLQLQQASRNRVPTRRLIAAHIGESLVFVPVMLGASFRFLSHPHSSESSSAQLATMPERPRPS